MNGTKLSPPPAARALLGLVIASLLLLGSALPALDRPVRSDVTVWHNFPAGYTEISQHYRLLGELSSPYFVASLPVDKLTALDIQDEFGATLPYTFGQRVLCDCQAMEAYPITITLPTVEAGYEFTLTYRFNQFGRESQAGILEYLVVEQDQKQHWRFLLPTPQAQVSDWSKPAPTRSFVQDGLLHVEYDLQRYRGPLILVYEPQGGYGPFDSQPWTVSVTVNQTPYRFRIYAPEEAGFAGEDIRAFAETLFPTLVEDMGIAPVHTTMDIAIRTDLPPNPWIWMSINDEGRHSIVQIYLNRYFRQPSLGLGHELVHDAIRGNLPIYMEEGLCMLWGWDRLVGSRWEALGLPPQQPIVIDLYEQPPKDMHLLAQAGYGTPSDASQGYSLGSSFVRNLAYWPERFGSEFSGTLGLDFVREMTILLHKEGSSLQDVVCKAAQGERFFALLQSLGVVQIVPEPGRQPRPRPAPNKVPLYPPEQCPAPAEEEDTATPEIPEDGEPLPGLLWALGTGLGYYVHFVATGISAANAPSYLCACPIPGMLLPYLGLGLAAGAIWSIGTLHLWGHLILGRLWPRLERRLAPRMRRQTRRWRNVLVQGLLTAGLFLPFLHIALYAQAAFWPPFTRTAIGLFRLISVYVGFLGVYAGFLWQNRRGFETGR